MVLNKSTAITALILLAVLGTRAEAETWRVEKDGTGDFTTIRPAIAASAPGDTILLGPGRYEEVEPFETPGWTEPTYVPITVDSLVLRGVDRDTVIIGPSEPNFVGFGPKGVVATIPITRFSLENLTIENVRDGAYLVARSDVRDCVVRACDLGITEFTTGARVEQTRFAGNEFAAVWTGTGCVDLHIEGCVLENEPLATGVSVNRSTEVVIMDCQFALNLGGIQFAENSTGTVESCTFSGCQSAITIRSESDVWLLNNRATVPQAALHVFDGSIARGSGNVLQGGYAAILMETTSTAFMSGNHILRDPRWAVRCEGFNLHDVDIDLRNNYWGTGIADSIATWIYDGNDTPPWEINLSNVLFEPFSPVPIPTKPESIGGLKSRFRPSN